MSQSEILIGIDVGSSGARAVAVTSEGDVLASCSRAFARDRLPDLPDGYWEQDPEDWWRAVMTVLADVVHHTQEQNAGVILGMSVCSTSGTLVLLDENREAVRPAIMYSDGRSVAQAKQVNDAAWRTTRKMGIGFGTSYALPKLLWVMENEEEVFERACLIAHAADVILGRLTGVWGGTDFNNALKTGYDVVDNRWPAYLATRLDVPRRMLPKVVPPGEFLGHLKPEIASDLGIEEEVRVVSGTTDGVAGLLASGASVPGDWCSTLGTTLVLKGILEERLKDPDGRFYCHLHPKGWWLPGGASNVGGQCLQVKFPEEEWSELDGEVENWMPTSLVVYPLMKEGERMPFKNPEAVGFMAGKATCDAELFTAHLEGVALVERWAFDVLKELDCPVGDELFVSGGACKSLPWLRIRASVLNRTLRKAQFVEPCMGMAILAAASTVHSDLVEATKAMVRIESEIEADPVLRREYSSRYRKLRRACDAIGYG